ncbi:MAG: acyl-CoA dehydrogenase family protein [Euzebyales bacterium]|jgi:alkylation response protein AidB-like acyl-CoA dehydrogenase|nr:acyl-CoA dehydrogenase family protein [Euzebyales bacterium]
MDLDLTTEQQAFRDEVRAWLEANAPAEPLPPTSTAEGVAAHQAWERRLYEAGYAAIHWPKAYGGRDADMLSVAIFSEEYARADGPERVNVLALGLAGPTLMVYGTDEQKARWLPGMLSCEDIWCQGFSEPGAGSDLAGLTTTAVRDDDTYIVNGQKTWTSQGRFADWMFALVRTEADAAKHRGITCLMIDMRSPGIDVRPIVQINGDAGFAEVFFTDVRVPAENVVGEVNDGWRVAMTTLGFERGTGLGSHVRFSRILRELVTLARAAGRDTDPIVRDRIAGMYAETEVFRHNTYRTLTCMAKGKPIGPEASLNKLYWSEMEVRLFETGMEVLGTLAELGPKSSAVTDVLGHDAAALWDHWHKRYWYARAACIYAGTSEIQKNIVAERLLGLPREPRG